MTPENPIEKALSNKDNLINFDQILSSEKAPPETIVLLDDIEFAAKNIAALFASYGVSVEEAIENIKLAFDDLDQG